MTKKKIGAIKVDWFNMRVEFSPNIEIVSKKGQSITGGNEIEETIFKIDITSEKIQPDKPEYKSYILESNSIEDDEPFDLDNPWYAESGEEMPLTSKKAPAPTPALAPTPAPAQKPAPAPTPAPTAPELPAEVQKQVIKLEAQLNSINGMVQKLDQSFSDGEVTQEEFLKKKNYLAEKMGALMGQIEQLKRS